LETWTVGGKCNEKYDWWRSQDFPANGKALEKVKFKHAAVDNFPVGVRWIKLVI